MLPRSRSSAPARHWMTCVLRKLFPRMLKSKKEKLQPTARSLACLLSLKNHKNAGRLLEAPAGTAPQLLYILLYVVLSKGVQFPVFDTCFVFPLRSFSITDSNTFRNLSASTTIAALTKGLSFHGSNCN